MIFRRAATRSMRQGGDGRLCGRHDRFGSKPRVTPARHPCPFNLFMHIPVRNGGAISFEPPLGKPGDTISFRAEMDAVVGFSACPQDMLPINGKDCVIHDAHYTIG